MKRFILLLAIFFSFIEHVYSSNEKVESTILPVKIVKTQMVEKSKIYTYPVSVEAVEETKIFAESVAFVNNINFGIGSKVKSNHSIMMLKPTSLDYSSIKIKSPIAGRIVDIPVKVGSHVKIGDLLVHILNPDRLSLFIEIPEAEIELLKLSQGGFCDL